MANRHHIIVSAENNAYMAWQCQLFHYSCLSRLRRAPVIFVHASGAAWHPGFLQIIRAGGIVRTAPSYKMTAGGKTYPPRNTPGTLLEAAGVFEGDDQLLVLCDPDMVFLRAPDFADSLAAEAVGYLDYGDPDVRDAAGRLGVPQALSDELNQRLNCGAPHVIPVPDARRLAEHWLAAIDAFTPGLWEVSMYAFGLAVTKLGLGVKVTHLTTPYRSFSDPSRGAMIHYCFGDEVWSKREYWGEERAALVWAPTAEAPPGTVLGEILAQIAEAERFYRGSRA